MTTMAHKRHGPAGEAANELESVLTAVVTSADVIADGDLSDTWTVQRELGALEDALTRALGLVRRLSALARANAGPPVVRGQLGDGTHPVDTSGFGPVGLDPRWDI